MSAIITIIYLAVIVLMFAGLWMTFTKAGQPGWAAIIPIYNIWILLRVIGRPEWWIVLLLIPFVDIVVGIIVTLDLAKSFRQSTGFGVGLILLPFVFYPILGFGSAQYQTAAA